jgi:isoprenylcysteine carboxyl methyltransferase (ICMT) family protein YpbQ
MDPINLLFLVNLIVLFSASFGAAKGSLKSGISSVVQRPATWLQKTPPNILALVTLLQFAGVFGFAVHASFITEEFLIPRVILLLLYIIFSWLQVFAVRNLGPNYTQDIAILKGHKLVEKGLYRFFRHPQYLFQLLADLTAGLLLASYPVVFITVFISVPMLILRARAENSLLKSYFRL